MRRWGIILNKQRESWLQGESPGRTKAEMRRRMRSKALTPPIAHYNISDFLMKQALSAAFQTGLDDDMRPVGTYSDDDIISGIKQCTRRVIPAIAGAIPDEIIKDFIDCDEFAREWSA
jgi:hypothetical protein